ncbi:hypothetical protein BH11PLA2_BH11PLA2_27580 [soil metagenome]
MNLEPAIVAFFLVFASPLVGVPAWPLVRRRLRLGRAIATSCGAFLFTLAIAAGCFFDIAPMPDLARWVMHCF